eukprot:4296186-Pleurochrysis_carterae.AAC.1
MKQPQCTSSCHYNGHNPHLPRNALTRTLHLLTRQGQLDVHYIRKRLHELVPVDAVDAGHFKAPGTGVQSRCPAYTYNPQYLHQVTCRPRSINQPPPINLTPPISLTQMSIPLLLLPALALERTRTRPSHARAPTHLAPLIVYAHAPTNAITYNHSYTPPPRTKPHTNPLPVTHALTQ